MEYTIQTTAPKLLAGKRARMSFAANTTPALWRSFMPERKHMADTIGDALYSVEIYPPSFFHPFSPEALFEKWAAVAVEETCIVPEGMETLSLPGGLYAVFLHKGPASAGPQSYDYIFRSWLPSSGFVLDDRPHYAVMDERYKHESPDSEEELWIPVRPQ